MEACRKYYTIQKYHRPAIFTDGGGDTRSGGAACGEDIPAHIAARELRRSL